MTEDVPSQEAANNTAYNKKCQECVFRHTVSAMVSLKFINEITDKCHKVYSNKIYKEKYPFIINIKEFSCQNRDDYAWKKEYEE